jgi:hypothetical protein
MPVSYSFESQFLIGPSGATANADGNNIDVTVTEAADNGSILPGDEVTLTQLDIVPPPEWTAIGLTPVFQGIDPTTGLNIYTAQVYYHGYRSFTTTEPPFFSENGYVFSSSFNFGGFGNNHIILFDSNLSPDVALEQDIEAWNRFSAPTEPLLYGPACFLGDTQIETPDGPRAVEQLSIGDAILTSAGEIRAVKWVGRQKVATQFQPAERLMPVRIAAGALGEGVPHADLTVTADHGMLVDGVICHAGALVNGTTITRVSLSEMGETYTVYHIETEEHEIILANGALAETFIDNVSRRVFDNYAEFEALYGDVPEMEELPYPRAMSARQVPSAIQARLAARLTG